MHQEPFISPIWAVHCNSSERNIGCPTGYYSSMEEAERKAKNRGWYGGNAPITEHPSICINNKTYLLANSGCSIDLDDKDKLRKEEIKANALFKLTDEEIQALVLKK